jgi:hypothetical protein
MRRLFHPPSGLIVEHRANRLEILFGIVLSADVLFLNRIPDHDQPAAGRKTQHQ